MVIKYYDNLKYYFLRYSKGWNIDMHEDIIKNNPLDEDAKKKKEFLDTKWQEAVNAECIYNIVYYRGIKVYVKGLGGLGTINKLWKVLDKKVQKRFLEKKQK